MQFVASILTILFVARASASKSIYGGNVQATSSEKNKNGGGGYSTGASCLTNTDELKTVLNTNYVYIY